MKKKIAAGLLCAALIVGGATVALGATDQTKLDELKSLTQQMFNIHKQIIDKEAEAGLITQQQADTMKQFANQNEQAREQALANGQVLGSGMGMGMGRGMGMRGGWSNNGQQLTDEQKKALTEAMEARLKAQEEAIQNGTFVPGNGGMGMHGGRWGGAGPWGTPSTSQSNPTN